MCTFHLLMAAFMNTAQSLAMDDPGLGIIFDCCLKAWFGPFLLVLLLLETLSNVFFFFKHNLTDICAKAAITEVTLNIIRTFHTFFGTFCIFSALLRLFLSQNRLQRISSDLNKIKMDLNIDRYPSQFLKEWLVVLAIFLMSIAIYFSFFVNDIGNLFGLVPYCLNMILCYILSGQISCLFLFVKNVYVELMRSKKYEETVACSQKLSKIVDNISQLYKLPILLIISWIFLLTICKANFILNQVCPSVFSLTIIIILEIGFIIYPVAYIIRSCNGLSQQVKKFNEQLYWIIVKDRSRQLLDNEMLDLHFIVLNEMAFTACDFFPIDNSLICSMISTATTYLVILLQYGKNYSYNETMINATLSY